MLMMMTWLLVINTLRPRKHGRHFSDYTSKCIFLNENVIISIKISLKFVPKGPINNIPVLVQIMAWRRPGNKPLSEVMMVCLLTHICVTRPQGVKCGEVIIGNDKLFMVLSCLMMPWLLGVTRSPWDITLIIHEGQTYENTMNRRVP